MYVECVHTHEQPISIGGDTPGTEAVRACACAHTRTCAFSHVHARVCCARAHARRMRAWLHFLYDEIRRLARDLSGG